MIGIETILLLVSFLILLGIVVTRLSDRLGLPILLLFLAIGMMAGEEGPGRIAFSDAGMAQAIAVIALVLILFSGGLDMRWPDVRAVLKPATLLATLGVLITALLAGILAAILLEVPLLYGLLLGAIVSSTDAAAVFSVLRTRDVNLRARLRPLLELESGSNDPMAVFLTVGCIFLLQHPDRSPLDLLWMFFLQMGIGGAAGFGSGKLIVHSLNRLRLTHEGLYPVFFLVSVMFIFAATSIAGGSGFLAVYVAAIVAGNGEFVHKKSLLRFFDGMAWLSQIAMFLALGLLVTPSNVLSVAGAGILVSFVLIFIARPAGVFLSLLFARYSFREKAFISWVGLRGAAPIILATFPLLAGLSHAELFFNIVFFIVLTSALFQGWSIVPVAKYLRLDEPASRPRQLPIEFLPAGGSGAEIVDIIVPYQSDVCGRAIVELGLPRDMLIVLIMRGDRYVVPGGGTVLEAGDTLLILLNKSELPVLQEIFTRPSRPS